MLNAVLVHNVSEGDELTINYIDGLTEDDFKVTKLLQQEVNVEVSSYDNDVELVSNNDEISFRRSQDYLKFNYGFDCLTTCSCSIKRDKENN